MLFPHNYQSSETTLQYSSRCSENKANICRCIIFLYNIYLSMIDRETNEAFWGIIQESKITLTPEADLDRRFKNAYFDERISGAAHLYALSGNHQIPSETHEMAMENLAAAAEDHGLDADGIQKIMQMHEPSLKRDTELPLIMRDTDFEE